jgi:hypothetical protein
MVQDESCRTTFSADSNTNFIWIGRAISDRENAGIQMNCKMRTLTEYLVLYTCRKECTTKLHRIFVRNLSWGSSGSRRRYIFKFRIHLVTLRFCNIHWPTSRFCKQFCGLVSVKTAHTELFEKQGEIIRLKFWFIIKFIHSPDLENLGTQGWYSPEKRNNTSN